MRAIVRSRFPQLFPGVVWEYFIIENPYARMREIVTEEVAKRDVDCYFGARQVTRREAMDYVEEHGLVPALETKDGTIWDTPDREFQRMFPMNTKEKRQDLEKYWEG